jgi:hypothetical protein
LAIVALDIFVFAVVGMNVFSGIRYGRYLTPDANFDSFGVAVMTLIRCATGENFNGIMHDVAVAEPFCVAGDNCGVSLSVSAVYWVCFYTMTTWILLSLMVAILLEAFDKTTDDTKTDVRRGAGWRGGGGGETDLCANAALLHA